MKTYKIEGLDNSGNWDESIEMIINPDVKSQVYHLEFVDGVILDIWAKDKEQVIMYLSEEGRKTLKSIS